MRFSAAIHQSAPSETVPELAAKPPVDRQPQAPQPAAPRGAQEPPPDLDQRVRLSGEW